MDAVQENATQQNAMAVEAGSAPVETTPVDTGAAGEVTESAPVEPQGDDATVETTETAGSEPSKVVKELIAQRKKRQEAERELAYYKGLAEGRQAHPEPMKAPEVPQPIAPPRLDEFQTYEEFEAANRQYVVQLAKQELVKEFEEKQAAKSEQEQAQAFQERITAAAAEDPRVAEIMRDPTLPVSTPMAEVIKASDVAPALLKYLDSHRADAQRIARMPTVLAARELGAIEATIKSTPPPPPPKRVSQAPAPVKTVEPTGAAVVDEAALPMDEWVKRRNESFKAKR